MSTEYVEIRLPPWSRFGRSRPTRHPWRGGDARQIGTTVWLALARGGIRFPIETASLPVDARSKLLVQKQNIGIFVGGGGTDGRGVATLI
jgi:hypothetical protein